MDEQGVELSKFEHKECFLYQIQPATSLGHRAESWGLGSPFKTVLIKVVLDVKTDQLYIKFIEKESGQLYAECPVPNDIPYTAVVEQCVDSSRYFVIKLVDRQNSKRHAFIGIGFRDRIVSTNFTAALIEHRRYLSRQDEAERIQKEQPLSVGQCSEGEEGQTTPPDGAYTMAPGQKLSMKLPGGGCKSTGTFISRTGNGAVPSLIESTPSDGTLGESCASSQQAFKFAPPPPPTRVTTAVQATELAEAESRDGHGRGGGEGGGTTSTAGVVSGGVVQVNDEDEDDWGEFIT